MNDDDKTLPLLNWKNVQWNYGNLQTQERATPSLHRMKQPLDLGTIVPPAKPSSEFLDRYQHSVKRDLSIIIYGGLY